MKVVFLAMREIRAANVRARNKNPRPELAHLSSSGCPDPPFVEAPCSSPHPRCANLERPWPWRWALRLPALGGRPGCQLRRQIDGGTAAPVNKPFSINQSLRLLVFTIIDHHSIGALG